MSNRIWRATVVVAALFVAQAMPAQAGIIDFEDATPTLIGGAEFVDSGGYRFTSDGFGFSGVDNAGAFVFGNAPANADGQFLFGLNNDGLTMTGVSGSAFVLQGFDYAFIAPLAGLGGNINAGRLNLFGRSAGGDLFESFEFPFSTPAGDFLFGTIGSAQLGSLASVELQSLTFFACVYQSDGSCSDSALDVPAQYGLDNIRVPEPGTIFLMLTGLAALGVSRRRIAR